MIGNDIIDIAKAKEDSNWQRPRFLEKLFTENEQQIIQDSENSFLMVWRLWSMKEAAYKLYTQYYPSRFYNPIKFECHIENNSGTVNFQDFEYYVETEITSHYILSEAALKPSSEASGLKSEVVLFQAKNIESSSLILKEELMNSVSKNFKISKDELIFKKDEFGIPIVEFQNNKTHISLTHHGRFGAFAYDSCKVLETL